MDILITLHLARHLLRKESLRRPGDPELAAAHEYICELRAGIEAMLAVRNHLLHDLTGDGPHMGHVGVIGAAIGAMILPDVNLESASTGVAVEKLPYDIGAIKSLQDKWLAVCQVLGIGDLHDVGGQSLENDRVVAPARSSSENQTGTFSPVATHALIVKENLSCGWLTKTRRNLSTQPKPETRQKLDRTRAHNRAEDSAKTRRNRSPQPNQRLNGESNDITVCVMVFNLHDR